MAPYPFLLPIALALQAATGQNSEDPSAAGQAAAATAVRIEHVAIQAADIDRSAAFYQAAFGLRLIPTPLANRRWLDLGNGVALHILDGRAAPKPSNRNEHLAMHVDDLGTVTAWLDSQGLPWTNLAGEQRTMQTRFDGVRQIYVQDPDGYWLEVSDTRGTAAP
ncbi:VOC family protein [Sphingomonas japonica]|uniref:Lactoylglutathione lyase n=1 Tax=Sphingomonas japonica TaxID=511662 RepID=A0ABX0U2H3_9SPHN|nr:VOC family protein [Sphingomonas japonica]NIJ23901.1 lactoylglutathione lyase [Sphingomonas japonica]